jgi:hypothetical protein
MLAVIFCLPVGVAQSRKELYIESLDRCVGRFKGCDGGAPRAGIKRIFR